MSTRSPCWLPFVGRVKPARGAGIYEDMASCTRPMRLEKRETAASRECGPGLRWGLFGLRNCTACEIVGRTQRGFVRHLGRQRLTKASPCPPTKACYKAAAAAQFSAVPVRRSGGPWRRGCPVRTALRVLPRFPPSRRSAAGRCCWWCGRWPR